MAPKLYMRIISPTCRAVLLTAKALDITLEHVQVNIGENLNPEFVKLNPQHTVPTLEDDGKIIWDSHAIIVYLVSKYGKNDSLYPKDLYKRAIIDQRLHFDSGVIFPLAKVIRNLIVLNNAKTVPCEQVQAADEVYGFLEKFLEGHHWIAGDNVTVADFSLIPSVMCLDFMTAFDRKKFPNVNAWINKVQALPCYDVNREGHEVLKKHFSCLLNA